MLYGLYLSAQGADAQTTRLDLIANNLANAQTSAFKRDLAIFAARDPHDLRNQVPGQDLDEFNGCTGGTQLLDVVTDFSNGSQIQTGGTYDVALAGPGFFQVADGDEQFLTRNGSLSVNANGELVTKDGGLNVLDLGGVPIVIPAEAAHVEIGPDGSVSVIDETGARATGPSIAVVVPESLDELTKIGNSLYATESDVQPINDQADVRQGYLEASGTQSVTEMLDLIEASRAFEANVNMIKFQDEALGRLLQAVPR